MAEGDELDADETAGDGGAVEPESGLARLTRSRPALSEKHLGANRPFLSTIELHAARQGVGSLHSPRARAPPQRGVRLARRNVRCSRPHDTRLKRASPK